MDAKTKAVRDMLRNGSPVKAKALLDSVGLPEREYKIILLHDIQDKDLNFVADTLGVCERQAKTIHREALNKIYDSLN